MMELKAGYKQTEVGVIPSDWETKTIEEIAEVKSGKRLPLGKSLIDSETYHPYIRVTDMYFGGVTINNIKFVPDEVFPLIKNYRIYVDDIFISVAGSLGIVGRIPEALDGANLTENANRLTNISCDIDFLLNILMSSSIQNKIDAEKTLGAQPKLALTRIRNFYIPLPPTKTEQTAIATALNDTDQLITQLEQLIAKKRNIKQGVMQALLKPKADWDTKKLGWIGSFKGGNGFPTKAQGEKNQQVPFYKVSDMNLLGNEIFMTNSNNWISEKIVNDIGAHCFPSNTIVFAKIGAAIFLERKKILSMVSCIDNNMMGFVVDIHTNDLRFIYFLFHSMKISLYANTTALPSINGKDLSDIDVKVPKKPEQTQIAQILTNMDTELQALEQKLAKYRMLKQGMMQTLLTGKTRLVKPNLN